jgi:hypothetical protein
MFFSAAGAYRLAPGTSPLNQDPVMNRVARLVAFVVIAVGLTACANPMAPSAKCSPKQGSACTNLDYVNPNVDYVNPNV